MKKNNNSRIEVSTSEKKVEIRVDVFIDDNQKQKFANRQKIPIT